MVRTQIQLEERQARELKRLAQEQSVSMAELIRRSVDAYVARQRRGSAQVQRALGVIGTFASGGVDGAQEHDRHLATAYGGHSE